MTKTGHTDACATESGRLGGRAALSGRRFPP